MPPVEFLSVAELLVLHARVGEELRERSVARSANNPTGDLAEYLFFRMFGWQQAPKSEGDMTPPGRMVRGIKLKAAAFNDATNRDSFQRFAI